jgi:hypothetical protein
MLRQRLGLDLFLAIGIALVVLRLFDVSPWTLPILDVHAYWATQFGLDYAHANPFQIGAYLYTPAFAQAIAPLTLLPFPVFAALWTALSVVVYVWLVGRWAAPLLLTGAVALELALGQIDIFIAAAIVVGFRYPAVWAFPLLTKVAPGVGLIWFGVRREWRKLAIALGVTVAIAAVSAFAAPGEWRAWFELMRRGVTEPAPFGAYIPIPLWLRLPIGIGLIAWGARTDRHWTVPVGVLLSMPILWINVFTLLIAVIPLREEPGPSPAREWLAKVLPIPFPGVAATDPAKFQPRET